MNTILSKYRGFSKLFHNRAIRIVIQIFVSIIILIVLIQMVGKADLLRSLQSISPFILIAAFSLFTTSILLGIVRWRILLYALGIKETFFYLFRLYFISIFFSLLLPTGTGGDVIRAYDVGVRHKALAAASLATLQERLLSLGALLFFGLFGSIIYRDILTPTFLIMVIAIQLSGILVCLLALFPKAMRVPLQYLWGISRRSTLIQSFSQHRYAYKIAATINSLTTNQSLDNNALIKAIITALFASLAIIGSYYLVGIGLNINISYTEMCLVVPMIFVVRMLPISLGGIGVGEGTLVILLQLFDVDTHLSLALGLIILAIHTLVALFGAVLLLLRMFRTKQV